MLVSQQHQQFFLVLLEREETGAEHTIASVVQQSGTVASLDLLAILLSMELRFLVTAARVHCRLVVLS